MDPTTLILAAIGLLACLVVAYVLVMAPRIRARLVKPHETHLATVAQPTRPSIHHAPPPLAQAVEGIAIYDAAARKLVRDQHIPRPDPIASEATLDQVTEVLTRFGVRIGDTYSGRTRLSAVADGLVNAKGRILASGAGGLGVGFLNPEAPAGGGVDDALLQGDVAESLGDAAAGGATDSLMDGHLSLAEGGIAAFTLLFSIGREGILLVRGDTSWGTAAKHVVVDTFSVTTGIGVGAVLGEVVGTLVGFPGVFSVLFGVGGGAGGAKAAARSRHAPRKRAEDQLDRETRLRRTELRASAASMHGTFGRTAQKLQRRVDEKLVVWPDPEQAPKLSACANRVRHAALADIATDGDARAERVTSYAAAVHDPWYRRVVGLGVRAPIRAVAASLCREIDAEMHAEASSLPAEGAVSTLKVCLEPARASRPHVARLLRDDHDRFGDAVRDARTRVAQHLDSAGEVFEAGVTELATLYREGGEAFRAEYAQALTSINTLLEVANAERRKVGLPPIS